MINKEDIKSVLNISSSGEDQNIEDLISYAYSIIPFSIDESENIYEYVYTNNGIFNLSCKTNDIIIDEIILLPDNTEIEIVKQLANNSFLTNYLYDSKLKVTFTSTKFITYIDNLAKDIVIYEYLKQPNKENYLIKTDSKIGDSYNKYISDVEFYNIIKNKIKNIWLF